MEPIYIKIYTNRIEIRDIHTQKEASVERNFSHSRMLIGDFYPAIEAIHIALKDLGINPSSFFCQKRNVVIHPLEKVEDGLSKVEIRLFNEVIVGGFNRKYKKIVISEKLTPLMDAEVIELIDKA
ncbi:YjaA family stress response protein [Proteus sp. FME41]|uniref:YjaA family stress response protein n=1 Tax=Proteus sp. FME41 TaxID=2742608 RepID=UPI001865E8A4|nr:YjaA family stress response protein [Proteus sp. FME41]